MSRVLLLILLLVLMACCGKAQPQIVVSTHWRSERLGLVTNLYTNEDRCFRLPRDYRVVQRWMTSSPWTCGQIQSGSSSFPLTCYEDVEMCRYIFSREEMGVLRFTEGMNRVVVPPEGPGERRDTCWVRVSNSDELLLISCSKIGALIPGRQFRP